MTGKGIDDQVDVVASQQLVVVSVGVAPQLGLGPGAALPQKIGDGSNLVLSRRSHKPAGVDIQPAAPLSQDADADGS